MSDLRLPVAGIKEEGTRRSQEEKRTKGVIARKDFLRGGEEKDGGVFVNRKTRGKKEIRREEKRFFKRNGAHLRKGKKRKKTNIANASWEGRSHSMHCSNGRLGKWAWAGYGKPQKISCCGGNGTFRKTEMRVDGGVAHLAGFERGRVGDQRAVREGRGEGKGFAMKPEEGTRGGKKRRTGGGKK